MFKFLKRTKKGNIEKEFKKLTLKNIFVDLSNSKSSPNDLAGAFCRFAIFAGLGFKKDVSDNEILQDANPDRVVIEAIAFSWSMLFKFMISNDSEVDIYEDQKLAEAIYDCSSVLIDILNKHADFKIEEAFSAYMNVESVDSYDMFAGRLLAAGKIEPLGHVRDHTLIHPTIKALSMGTIPNLINALEKILKMYALKFEHASDVNT